MANKKVLITGMSGLIGGALRAHLEARGGYELTGLNRRAVPGVRTHQGDIRDLEAIAPAFAGQETVVHLAALVSMNPTIQEMMEYNLLGTYNVFEAAKRAGCKRVIFASSGATVAGYELDEPYKSLAAGKYEAVKGGWPILTHTSPLRPRGLYGASKAWGESLARSYTDTSALSILCVRIGRVNEEDKAADTRTRAVWSSHRDIVTLLEAAIQAPPSVKFDIVFGCSNNKYGYRDMTHTKDVLGFTPQDSADAFYDD